jgi:hypothetical protein
MKIIRNGTCNKNPLSTRPTLDGKMLGFGDLKDMAKAKDHAPQHQPTKKDGS